MKRTVKFLLGGGIGVAVALILTFGSLYLWPSTKPVPQALAASAPDPMTQVWNGTCLEYLTVKITSELADAAFKRGMQPCDGKELTRNKLWRQEYADAFMNTLNPWSALDLVPAEFITQDHAAKALESEPNAFGSLPQALQTQANLDLAIREGLLTTRDWPESLMTERNVLRLMRNYDFIDEHKRAGRTISSDILSTMPDELITSRIAFAAVRRQAWALGSIPRERRTYAMCLIALREDDDTLQYCPPYLLLENGRGKRLVRSMQDQ